MTEPEQTEGTEILLVEDSMTQAVHLKQTLERHGFTTRHARNGTEALALLRERRSALVITDITMPGMNGYDLCCCIRADAALADLPVILLTSLSSPEDVVHGLECGADHFITKPYEEDYLISRVRYILAERPARSERMTREPLDVFLGGKKHRITADRLQILSFLSSTFEAAVQRNQELIRAQDELRRLNETLEQKVRERTAALEAEMSERARIDAEHQRLLRERESLLDSTSDGIYGIDADGKCTFINPTGAELLGHEPARLIGASMHELVQHHRPDGGVYRVEESPIYQTYKQGKPCRVESDVFWRRDGTSFPVEYAACPIREDGGVRGAVVTFRDITEKKRLQAEVLRANRVESVGRLASGIAHDMNNILAPIMMSAPLLRMQLSPQEVEKTLATIEASAKRGADLVRQLLIFGRGIEGHRGPVNARELIGEIVRMIRETFPRNIIVNAAVPKSTWAVRGDATQLHQVFLNLCVNARDAMPDGGTLSIESENLQVDASYATIHPDAKPGPYVLLRVIDTGVGIAPDIADKIFEPFFTTKETGRGTGLGLSTVMGIVKSHGGFVTLRTQLGKGSAFLVHLPAMPGEIADGEEEEAAPPMGNGELLLLVDDEESIRSVLRETLRRHNYRVETARDGAEASAVFARNAADVKLVITDLDMPFLDGVNLIRVLRRLNPSVRVIVSSGLGDAKTAQERLAELKTLGVKTVLAKPYTADKILNAVHRAITRGKGE